MQNLYFSYIYPYLTYCVEIWGNACNKIYFDKETMQNLYFSYIYPYLTYCVEIWGNACNILLDPIVELQKNVIVL